MIPLVVQLLPTFLGYPSQKTKWQMLAVSGPAPSRNEEDHSCGFLAALSAAVRGEAIPEHRFTMAECLAWASECSTYFWAR